MYLGQKKKPNSNPSRVRPANLQELHMENVPESMAEEKPIKTPRKKRPHKLKGLKLDGSPNAHWAKFKEKIDNYANVPEEEWGNEEIIGYIFKLYKDKSGMDFSLSYSGGIKKCPEQYAISRMKAFLGTEDPKIIKRYIEWAFSKCTSLKSLAWFYEVSLINRFKSEFRLLIDDRILRSTSLSPQYKEVVDYYDVPAATFGELAFAKLAVEQNPGVYLNYALCLKKLRTMGLTDSLLDCLEDG